ncbi:MAG TPA: HAMP domain-containing sensor histidine kinase, partial [Caulobacteraceae bacterium]|nr:HAMP domain-containing sensor histidine kinase [Caulobacteraceae bacterium]
MRLPRLLRTTPFRLTLLFLALFAASASAFLAYIYIATAGEVSRRADAGVSREIQSLDAVYRSGGFVALNQAVIERASVNHGFLYLLMSRSGAPISGSIAQSPVRDGEGDDWASFMLTETDADGAVIKRPARGREERLGGGELLFVGADVGESQSYVVKILRALWGAGALVIVLGLAGGVFISRGVERNMASLNGVIEAVRRGELDARATLRGAGDEYDELATGLNDMLDRLQRSIAGLRHAGDAIAHDLRSPLTRLRARLEAAMIEADAGRADPRAALHQALDDADGVLRTFAAVLAIARLEAAGDAPNQAIFDPAVLAADVAELYEPLCEDKGLDFRAELTPGLHLVGNQEFIAQALANLLDNAVKYTPSTGAIMLRVRRRSSGDIEFSVTDTGPGVAEEDRASVIQRFVRLENSRNQPGAGLGLS